MKKRKQILIFPLIQRFQFAAFGFVILFVASSCITADSKQKEDLPVETILDIMEQSVLTSDSPVVFAYGCVSTAANERDIAISPDGKEIFFSISTPKGSNRAIAFVKKGDKGWSQPEIATFSGLYPDIEPCFSLDGKRLFFASKRPACGGGAGKDCKRDWDIWFVERDGSGWSSAVNLGLPVNTDKDQSYPCLTQNGNLYFTLGCNFCNDSDEGIYCSQYVDGHYTTPYSLDDSVNSGMYDFNAWVSADEQLLIFSPYVPDDDFGGGDLYSSVKHTNGKWSKAANMGKKVNSDAFDCSPLVYNQTLFFTSERIAPMPERLPMKYSDFTDMNQNYLNGMGNIFCVKFDKQPK